MCFAEFNFAEMAKNREIKFRENYFRENFFPRKFLPLKTPRTDKKRKYFDHVIKTKNSKQTRRLSKRTMPYMIYFYNIFIVNNKNMHNYLVLCWSFILSACFILIYVLWREKWEIKWYFLWQKKIFKLFRYIKIFCGVSMLFWIVRVL